MWLCVCRFGGGGLVRRRAFIATSGTCHCHSPPAGLGTAAMTTTGQPSSHVPVSSGWARVHLRQLTQTAWMFFFARVPILIMFTSFVCQCRQGQTTIMQLVCLHSDLPVCNISFLPTQALSEHCLFIRTPRGVPAQAAA